MPSIINSDSGAISGSAGLKFTANNDGILEIQNDGITSFVVSNQYIKVPVGNISTRANVIGAFRFNNESNLFETYNGNAWLDVSEPPPPPPFNVEYLVVAGGGSGGGGASGYEGGGGGAGGLRTSFGSISGGGANAESNLTINRSTVYTSTSYMVTVGAGGGSLANGSPSVFFTVSSLGGGRGSPSSSGTGAPGVGGFSGGSGGGAATPGATEPTPTSFGGTGTANQGYPGGKSWAYNGSPGNIATGGGGGAGQAGQNAAPAVAGPGGNGIPSTISGANVFYAGGGGGGAFSGTRGTGGLGGGGNGGRYPDGGQTNGTANRGGGGGGSQTSATSGGSGIIILRYPNIYTISNPTGGLTFTTDSANVAGYKITTFTAGTGNILFS